MCVVLIVLYEAKGELKVWINNWWCQCPCWLGFLLPPLASNVESRKVCSSGVRMDSLERLMRTAPLPKSVALAVTETAASSSSSSSTSSSSSSSSSLASIVDMQGGTVAAAGRRALVHASLASAVGRKGRHLTGTFCLTGDTMEGIIQCLVFLKAFSVSMSFSIASRSWGCDSIQFVCSGAYSIF